MNDPVAVAIDIGNTLVPLPRRPAVDVLSLTPRAMALLDLEVALGLGEASTAS